VESLHRESPLANPCPDEECFVCSDARARALAAHLGLAGEPDPTIEADARAADAVRWNLFSPDLPRTYRDEENPGEAEPWGPDDPDDATRLELFPWAKEGGCFENDLTPEEEAMEILGEPAWERACREHAEEMEAMAQEALYHELIDTLGGFPADW
jgi:hypothetical protein